MSQLKLKRMLNLFTIVVVQLVAVLAISTNVKAQELKNLSESSIDYSILEFSPNEVSAKLNAETTVELIARNIQEKQYIEMFVIPGEGVEITGITEMASDILSIGKGIEGGVATLTIAKTNDQTFSEGEVVAAVTFKLTADTSSILELGEDSNIGGVAIKQSVSKLKIIAPSDVSTKQAVSTELENNSVFYEKEVPVASTEATGDIFQELSTKVNVDRSVLITAIGSIFILVGVLASIALFRPQHEFSTASGYNSQFMATPNPLPSPTPQMQVSPVVQNMTNTPTDLNPANLVPVQPVVQQVPQATIQPQVNPIVEPTAEATDFPSIRGY